MRLGCESTQERSPWNNGNAGLYVHRQVRIGTLGTRFIENSCAWFKDKLSDDGGADGMGL